MGEQTIGTFLRNLLLILVLYVVIGFGLCFGVWLFCAVAGWDTGWIRRVQQKILSIKLRKAKDEAKEEQTS